MGENELPLAMLDSSFLQNGKEGLLLTNRRLYSSLLKKAISLAEIHDVAVERPTLSEQVLLGLFGLLYVSVHGRLKTRLLVNGETVYWVVGTARFKCWADMLTELGKATRAPQ